METWERTTTTCKSFVLYPHIPGKPRTDVPTRSPVRAEAAKERVSVSPSKRTITRREEPSTSSSSSQPKTTVKTAGKNVDGADLL